MKRWTKVALVVAALCMAAGTIAWGGRGGRGFFKHMLGAHIDKALDYVDATPEQRAVVNQVKQDIMAKAKAHRQANQGLREQVATLLAADTLDQAALNAIADKKADEMKAFAHEVVADIAKVHASLRPEQRQKLYARWKEKQAQRKARHEEHDGGFGGTEQ
jgi:Spy/CpxP family protein refolding chaperone